jgi:hypothetical protein
MSVRRECTVCRRARTQNEHIFHLHTHGDQSAAFSRPSTDEVPVPHAHTRPTATTRACAREGRISACDSLPRPRTQVQPDRTLTGRIPAIGSSVGRIYKAPWPFQTRTMCVADHGDDAAAAPRRCWAALTAVRDAHWMCTIGRKQRRQVPHSKVDRRLRLTAQISRHSTTMTSGIALRQRARTCRAARVDAVAGRCSAVENTTLGAVLGST